MDSIYKWKGTQAGHLDLKLGPYAPVFYVMYWGQLATQASRRRGKTGQNIKTKDKERKGGYFTS